MITNRHLLPLFFAFACMVGMGWTCSGQGPLVDKNIQLDPGQAQELGPITDPENESLCLSRCNRQTEKTLVKI